MLWRMYINNHPRFGPWYRQVRNKPSWVVKAALVAAILTIVVPVAMLMIAAVVVGVTIFAVLGVIAWVLLQVRLLWHRITGGHVSPPSAANDGRVNVRVVERG